MKIRDIDCNISIMQNTVSCRYREKLNFRKVMREYEFINLDFKQIHIVTVTKTQEIVYILICKVKVFLKLHFIFCP